MNALLARRKTKLIRFAGAWLDSTGIGLIGFVIAAIGLVQTVGQASANAPTRTAMPHWTSYVLVGLGVGLMLLHMRRAYRASTYDTEVAWRLVDDWHSEDLITSRTEAAHLCLTYLITDEANRTWSNLKKTNQLEIASLSDVLDVLEDVAFFLKSGRLSDEIAYHYFAHYVFLYWLSGGKEFVAEKRATERATWMNLEHCFDRLLLLESELTNSPQEDIKNHVRIKRREYLQEERDLTQKVH